MGERETIWVISMVVTSMSLPPIGSFVLVKEVAQMRPVGQADPVTAPD